MNETTDKMQEEQLTALKDLRDDVSKLIESFKQVHRKYVSLSRMHITADSDFFGQLLHLTKVQLTSINVIHDEQERIKENAKRIKTLIVQENKLTSEDELLKEQQEAFVFLQNMESHLDSLYNVSEVSRLTLQELQQQHNQRSHFNDFGDQVLETVNQLDRGITIAEVLKDHLDTLISVQETNVSSNRLISVQNSLDLQKNEIIGLLNKIISWDVLFKNILTEHHFSKQATRGDIDACLSSVVKLLETAILPEFQKAMRYEEGMSRALKTINSSTTTSTMATAQQEVLLFISSFRTDFRELNTKQYPKLLAALKATKKPQLTKGEYILTYRNVWHTIHWTSEKFLHLQTYAEKATAYINQYMKQ